MDPLNPPQTPSQKVFGALGIYIYIWYWIVFSHRALEVEVKITWYPFELSETAFREKSLGLPTVARASLRFWVGRFRIHSAFQNSELVTLRVTNMEVEDGLWEDHISSTHTPCSSRGIAWYSLTVQSNHLLSPADLGIAAQTCLKRFR